MTIIKHPQEMQQMAKELGKKKSIGFVPTMGGLHQGHFALIEQAKKDNDICVVSIFLNPTQFDNKEDLATYPAFLQDDIKALKDLSVSILFAPQFSEIYPDNYQYKVSENSFSQELCGAHRPGHFYGVLTVVLKLLNIIKPHRAYFGEKDYQQLQLIQGMVKAFFLETQIVSSPTIRDEKGLALSSRNKKLSPEGLKKARYFASELKTNKSLSELKESLNKKGIQVDYLEEKKQRRFAAVNIENVRLIDNVPI